MTTMGIQRGGSGSTRETDLKLGITYGRYSTDMQGSKKEQNGINEELAEANDVTIVARFFDSAQSRSIGDRKDLMDAFDYLRQHRDVRYLIANELERLTAGPEQRVTIASLCKTLAIWIVTEDGAPIDPHNETQMQEADERAIKSKGEVVKIQRRVKRSLRQKAMNGVVILRPPYGVRMVPLVGPDGQTLPSGVRMIDEKGKKISSGKIETHPDEYRWLLKMFQWADDGMGGEDIARALNAEGVPTKTGNNPWRGVTVLGILKNPLYKGEIKWGRRQTRRDENGKTFNHMRDEGDSGIVTRPSPLGAIVPEDQWERINLRREQSVGTRRSNKRVHPKQPLDDFIYCGYCGYRMYGRNDAKGDDVGMGVLIWRYMCRSHRAGVEPATGYAKVCTKAKTMAAVKIIEALGAAGTSGSDVLRLKRLDTEDVSVQMKDIEKSIRGIEAALDKAEDYALQDLIPVAKLRTAKAKHDLDLAEQLDRQTALVANVGVTTEDQIKQMTVGLRGVAEKLSSDLLPVDHKIAALRRIGIQRIYVTGPLIEVQFSG